MLRNLQALKFTRRYHNKVIKWTFWLSFRFGWLRHFTQNSITAKMPFITALAIINTKEYLMKKIVIYAILSIFISNNVYAVKECRVKTDKLYVGDNGSLWMVFIGGGVANMTSSDVDFERTYSMLLAAQMADKEVTVRFQDDNAQCNTGTRSDIVGVWVHR